jgi:hypothetical protein
MGCALAQARLERARRSCALMMCRFLLCCVLQTLPALATCSNIVLLHAPGLTPGPTRCTMQLLPSWLSADPPSR